jgi:hypothetical protein
MALRISFCRDMRARQLKVFFASRASHRNSGAQEVEEAQLYRSHGVSPLLGVLTYKGTLLHLTS